jgi:hypothetical protein
MESKLHSIGKPKMVFTVTLGPKAKDKVIGDLVVAVKRCVVVDHGSEVAMISSIKIGGIANGAAKLDWFERIGIVEGEEFSNQGRVLGHEPQIESKVTGVNAKRRNE